MSDLFTYYESELRFIREMGAEFARKYPQASRLKLEEKDCGDPHVERLIEAFALIAGRIRHKLDDEFPEITNSLLDLLYPHYLRPVPSMAIAQFEGGSGGSASPRASFVERGTQIRTRPLQDLGIHCSFRSCYPVTLVPLKITGASIRRPGTFPSEFKGDRAVAAIRIDFENPTETSFTSMAVDQLRLYIDGDPSVVSTLYELIFNNVFRVILTSANTGQNKRSVTLPVDCIREVGFGVDEGVLPYAERSFLGYRLLQEYLSFPKKFHFFDLAGLRLAALASNAKRFEMFLLLSEFPRAERLETIENAISAETFRLGCTPIVNLFSKTAEPIRLTHSRNEYRVVPDLHSQSAHEVYSIDRVTAIRGLGSQSKEYYPFYSLRHSYDEKQTNAYWHASRRPSAERRHDHDTDHSDNGTDVYLALVDLDFRPTTIADETISADLTCTNRDVPAKLELRYKFGELGMEMNPMVQVRFLHRPTPSLRPALRNGLQWRIISHLALNHLSLGGKEIQGALGADAFREILSLYNFSNNPAVRKEIEGISSISSRLHIAPMSSAEGLVFARGLQTEIEFTEENYAPGGPFLFSSLLERFLGLYGAINSFTQTIATVNRDQRKEVLKKWKPRAGEQIVM
ncbi:MAG: type VI secretion system baseplate subunit TssF [Bryobacteraceae bacterium]